MRAVGVRAGAAAAILFGSLGVGGARVGGGTAPRAAEEVLPNVLIFVTDDQRTGTMGVMRETLDWFDRRGVEYPRSVATTPVCCPSRASIMTGRYTHNHGVENNHSPQTLDERSTVQRYLQEAGYLTAITGKIFNNWPLQTEPRYWDRWSVQTQGYDYTKFNIDGRVERVEEYTTDFLAERALEYLRYFERRDASPWFLYVAPYAPHGPFKPADRHRRARVPAWTSNPAYEEADRSDKPPFVQSQHVSGLRVRKNREGQLRTLLAVDELVATVMEQLGKDGERNGTLAFFVSDNGFFWGEHGVGDKRLPYLQAVNVPFYARWPDRLPSGVADGRLAANVDITPTILEAAGLVPDPEFPLDGRSLLAPDARDHILLEYPFDEATEVPPWAAYLDERRQYTEYYGLDGEVTYREFYDLKDDPWQLLNLLGDADEANDPSETEIARLSVTLARERRCVGTEGADACP